MTQQNSGDGDRPHSGEETKAPPAPARSRSRDQGWITSDKDALRRYAGRMVAVYDCKVWGSGETLEVALKEALAQPDAPPASEFLLAHVPQPDEDATFPYSGKAFPFPKTDARR